MDMIEDHKKTLKDYRDTANIPPEDFLKGIDTPIVIQKSSEERIHSPQKMKYAAEVTLIKRTYGDLEDIRRSMGLSQRKICQLLMVDPSAWTRWTKREGEAPHHIYRALQWFLLLQEKDPSLGNPYSWLQSVARPSLPKAEIQALGSEIKELLLKDSASQLAKTEKKIKWLMILNGFLVVLSLILLVRLFL